MSYEAVGLLPSGAQIALRIPLVLLGVLGLVLALSNSRRLGGRAAMFAAMGSAAFALDAILNVVWIAMGSHIYRSTSSINGYLDFFTVTDVVLLAVAMTLLAVSFTGRAAGTEPAPLFSAPAAPGGYPGYPPPPYQPPTQPQSPYSPPAWPGQGPAQPAGPVFSQPGGYAQPPGYAPQPSYPQSEQPPAHAHPQPPAHHQPPNPPAFAPPSYPHQTQPHQAQPHQAQPAPVYPPAGEAPTHHVPSAPPHSAPPEPPYSAPPAHHS